ncbi:unnamed protein product [Lymnaea stagnalis]|uniref:Cation-dependent mannose-6-phosphate receptor n=1 Tax=Lymnaea stagnalis TaxID=6523 RepID=A0AAV2HP25_LYMST
MAWAVGDFITAFVTISCLLNQGRVSALLCEGDGPCRCKYNDGSGTVDISSLGNQDGTARFPDVVSSFDGSSYAYNPCFPATLGSCKDAAACKKAGDDYIEMGEQSTAIWSYTGYYPLVTYTTPDGKKTEVMFLCDATRQVPQLDVIGEVITGTVSMNMWSNCACPNQCKRVDPLPTDSSLTTGSIMVIIFFSMLFVYLIFGLVFNYTNNKTGKELLPNYGFWSSVHGLIADGFRLVFTCSCGRSKAQYDAI